MKAIPPSDVLANLSWRYAVKKFDASRKVPADVWSALEKAAVLSPSSYGLQPWRFVVVTNPDVRQKLKAASWNQPQITDASHLVVFCRRVTMTVADVDKLITKIVEVRGVPKESLDGYRGMMVGSVSNPSAVPGGSIETWTRSQTYIALGVFLSAAAMMGVDACPMEGFDPKVYDEVLGLQKDGYTAVVLATAGYRAADDGMAGAKKVRFAEADVIRRV